MVSSYLRMSSVDYQEQGETMELCGMQYDYADYEGPIPFEGVQEKELESDDGICEVWPVIVRVS